MGNIPYAVLCLLEDNSKWLNSRTLVRFLYETFTESNYNSIATGQFDVVKLIYNSFEQMSSIMLKNIKQIFKSLFVHIAQNNLRYVFFMSRYLYDFKQIPCFIELKSRQIKSFISCSVDKPCV